MSTAGTNITLNENNDLSLRYTAIIRPGAEFADSNALATYKSRMPGELDHALSIVFRYFYQ